MISNLRLHRRHRTGAASPSHLAVRGADTPDTESRREAAFALWGRPNSLSEFGGNTKLYELDKIYRSSETRYKISTSSSMNSVTPPFLISPGSAKHGRASIAGPYASEAQTAALLDGGAEYRRQRIQASDMISTDEAAELTGATRATINTWIKTGRCIGVTHLRRGFRVPKWQFEPYVFPVLQSVARALGTCDGWQLMSFLETPLDALDGLAPRTALEQGVSAQRIIDLANAEGH